MKKKDIDELAVHAFDKFTEGEANTTLLHLLTTNERITVGRRILIANAILAGKTRMEINNHIHVSPNTFTQISNWLRSESNGYTSAYKQDKRYGPDYTPKRTEPFSYEDLKRRYPAHFLLFSLIEELWKAE